jgi:hypothetical protein
MPQTTQLDKDNAAWKNCRTSCGVLKEIHNAQSYSS